MQMAHSIEPDARVAGHFHGTEPETPDYRDRHAHAWSSEQGWIEARRLEHFSRVDARFLKGLPQSKRG